MDNSKANNTTKLRIDTHRLFTVQTLLFSIFGLLLNLILAQLVIKLGLPLYIDNVGSVLVGALAGPVAGMTVGFLSNAVNSIKDPITMYYGILTVVMAGLASIYAQHRLFERIKGIIFITLSFIVIGGGIGSLMTWMLYGGGIGGIGAPIATSIHNTGIPSIISQFIADMIIDIPDKTITIILVLILLKIFNKLLPNAFPLSHFHLNRNKFNGPDNEEHVASQEATVDTSFIPKKSLKNLVLRLILLSAILISAATISVSFYMYCQISTDFYDKLAYLIRLISVSFALTLLIWIVTIWFATERIVDPIKKIVNQSREFRTTTDASKWLESDTWKNREIVKSGDEIEELYLTLCDEQETVARSVSIMKETEEKLRHSKELEDALTNAKQASLAKGQFLSRMSHEIRTPLNAVIGYMSIAKDSDSNPDKIMHCIENSELAAKHLLHIINDVLDISSIESGKMKIAHEEFDLKDELSTISTLFYNQAKNKNVTFKTSIHNLTDEWIIGDSLRVNQILMNLLSNAVKFTPENGTVKLDVTQMNEKDNNIFLKFTISDTGIGMSKEYQGKLFTPFEQENATTAQKYGGTGLGLSITGNLISMMNGAIDVTSVLNEGSTFTVTLPFEKSTKTHLPKSASKDYSNVRALVVDDEKDSCLYVKSLLKRCGVKADTVNSGIDAIKQINRRKGTDYSYDLCIMDWNMPEMNGIEAAKMIRKENGDLPIIIATAYDITDIEDEATNVGVNKIIAKPLFQSTMFDLLVSTYGKYEPAPSNDQASIHLDNMNILLAEDNEMNAEIAVSILTKAGLTVETAENGQEAVDKFISNPDKYDAVLMDIQMPIMDGYTATKTIRNLDLPKAKEIPIIAMTANAFNEDISAALSSGMNDHISKPIDYDKLFTALSKIKSV